MWKVPVVILNRQYSRQEVVFQIGCKAGICSIPHRIELGILEIVANDLSLMRNY
jgi:hypothetical protein